ncbi:hypothetical protein F5Y16DRAFT_406981 [Xylariaceae sp. FL0255]|nr:hypothetical protein F5Y16DRAFT_406981 [Xylariaceae sp. FL0255]
MPPNAPAVSSVVLFKFSIRRSAIAPFFTVSLARRCESSPAAPILAPAAWRRRVLPRSPWRICSHPASLPCTPDRHGLDSGSHLVLNDEYLDPLVFLVEQSRVHPLVMTDVCASLFLHRRMAYTHANNPQHSRSCCLYRQPNVHLALTFVRIAPALCDIIDDLAAFMPER